MSSISWKNFRSDVVDKFLINVCALLIAVPVFAFAKANSLASSSSLERIESKDEAYAVKVRRMDSLLRADNPEAALNYGFNLLSERQGKSDPLDTEVFYLLYQSASTLEEYTLMLDLLPVVKELADRYQYTFGMKRGFYDFESARLHYALGNYPVAIQNYRSALTKTRQERVHIASIHNNIGLAFQKMYEVDSAMANFKRAEKVLEDSDLPLYSYSPAYADYFLKVVRANQIPFLLKEGLYQQALKYSEEQIRAAKAFNEAFIVSAAYRDLAKIHFGLGDMDLVRNYIDSARQKLGHRKHADVEYDLYQLEALLQATQGNEDAALRLSLQFSRKRDSLERIQREKSLYNGAFANDIRVWRHRAELANTNLKSAETSRQNYLKGLGAFGALSLLTTFFLVVNFKKNKKVKQQKGQVEKLLREKELLFSEMHHRIKNNLQTISSMIILSSENHQDEWVRQEFEKIILQLESIGKVHDLLYQQSSTKDVQVKEYLTSLINYYIINHSDVKIIRDLHIDDITLKVERIIPLGLVLSELLTNSYKYAFTHNTEETLTVKLEVDELDRITFYYSDNHRYQVKNEPSDDPQGFHGNDLIKLLIADMNAEHVSVDDHTYDLRIVFKR